MNIQDWFPLGLTGLIALQSKGLLRVFSNTTVQNHQFFGAQLSLWSNSHIHTWLLKKPWPWLRRTFVDKVMSLLFNMLSRWVITFLPRSKCLLICCCCSVTQLCPTICDSMDCSTPCCPVLHHLLEPAQTHVHWVCNAIQPSHPLSSPSPPAFNLSQHQGLFQWVSCSHQVAKYWASASASVLPMNIQDWFHFRLTDLISLQSKGLSRVSFNTTTQKHKFFSAQLSSQSNSHIHDHWKNHSFD